MTLNDIIIDARQKQCSDIHISEGSPLMYRIDGALTQSDIVLEQKECRDLILGMLNERQNQDLAEGIDIDLAITSSDGNRQRVNVFTHQGKAAATIRLLNGYIPTLEELQLPKVLERMSNEPRGLVLVTGPTGSGKSTTLAAMINYINNHRKEHIITIEDPIEYVYEDNQSIIHQREVGIDTKSFDLALRSSLREDPDVILVGEMRDYETISAAVTAAETGHLVLSTLHTTGAAQTIDRIIDACPGDTQNQIRTQLAGVLQGVITQSLVPKIDNGRIAATEVLVGTDAVLNLIRENKCFQLNSAMQSGMLDGMHTLNKDLARLVKDGVISMEVAFKYTNDRKDLEEFL